MKKITLLPPCGALAIALFILVASSYSSAQTAADTSPAKSASPEELNQAELLKSYLQLREQLHATQLAIANNRLEAEATARAQASTIAEKLEAITSAMEAERERHRIELERSNADRERYRAETQRLNAERERQQAETEHSNHVVLWVAGTFGAVGLLSMLLTPLFQWRTLHRLTEITAAQPKYLGPGSPGLLTEGAVASSDQTVALSNQRLMSAIERMERRIFEFEQAWVQPRSPASLNGGGGETARRATAAAEQATRIDVLIAKGQSLLEIGKTVEALACYNEILRLDLNHPEALVKRGAALERLKQDDEAIQCYDRAIKADRKMTLAYLHKGAVCNRLERYEEAVKCYEQALLVEAEG